MIERKVRAWRGQHHEGSCQGCGTNHGVICFSANSWVTRLCDDCLRSVLEQVGLRPPRKRPARPFTIESIRFDSDCIVNGFEVPAGTVEKDIRQHLWEAWKEATGMNEPLVSEERVEALASGCFRVGAMGGYTDNPTVREAIRQAVKEAGEAAAKDLPERYRQIRIAQFGTFDDCDEEHKWTLGQLAAAIRARLGK